MHPVTGPIRHRAVASSHTRKTQRATPRLNYPRHLSRRTPARSASTALCRSTETWCVGDARSVRRGATVACVGKAKLPWAYASTVKLQTGNAGQTARILVLQARGTEALRQRHFPAPLATKSRKWANQKFALAANLGIMVPLLTDILVRCGANVAHLASFSSPTRATAVTCARLVAFNRCAVRAVVRTVRLARINQGRVGSFVMLQSVARMCGASCSYEL